MSTENEIIVPEQMSSMSLAIRDEAKSLTITSPSHYALAADHLKTIKGQLKKVSDWFLPMKQNADQQKKLLLEKERSLLAPLEDGEQALKSAMLTYAQAEEAKRRAEERRLQAEADARAAAERARIQAEANRIKAQEDAARAKAEAANIAAEEASGAERTRKLAVAAREELKARLAAEERQAMEESAAQVVAPVVSVARPVQAVAGISTRKTWKAEVVDINLVPREYMVVNDRAIQALAKGLGAKAVLPGVRFVAVESIASRSA